MSAILSPQEWPTVDFIGFYQYTIKMLLVILPYIQIVISALLIVAILLQKQGTGLGSAFGGGDGGSYASRRGFEKILFYATIVLAILFLTSAFINLLLK